MLPLGCSRRRRRGGGGVYFDPDVAREALKRRSVIVTTNLAFSEWVRVFGGDEKLTTALIS